MPGGSESIISGITPLSVAAVSSQIRSFGRVQNGHAGRIMVLSLFKESPEDQP